MQYNEYKFPLIDKDKLVLKREQFIKLRENQEIYADYHYELAQLFFEEGDVKNVEKHIDEALKINSDYLKAQLLKTKLYIERNNLNKAKEIMKPIREKHNDYADVIYLNAFLYYISENLSNAMIETVKALQINKFYLDAHLLELAIYYKQRRLHEIYDKRKVVNQFNIPNIETEYFYHGLLSYESKQYLSGIYNMELAWLLGFDFNLCSYNCACFYVLINNYTKAQELFKNCIKDKKETSEIMQQDPDLKEFIKTNYYLVI
ncbi:hypothetical protein BVX93_02095 [bacterium B13(2017)]|nr:hypothetical protein BVX93_02095 [bacterium B13(2017)]